MTWIGSPVSVAELLRDPVLLGDCSCLGAAKLDFGTTAYRMEQLVLFPVSIWQKANAADLVFRMFYLRTIINYIYKKSSPKAKF